MVEAHEKRQAVQSRAHKNLDALQQKWQAAQAVADAFKRQLEEARAEVVRESEPEPELDPEEEIGAATEAEMEVEMGTEVMEVEDEVPK